MIAWFKEGKNLPKRYVWEIALGCHEIFTKEESLVDVGLRDGVTCDVIGDVHGIFVSCPSTFTDFFSRAIL
jgi:serine/threonine-protein phosphatase 5